ncbi:CHAP domain-containing protein, partial [Nonomuraea sp. 3-1Str]|uniref:CHAP domain-containing protein n=1 Tax=Nonomuraea sp. 3-1Str TaxID=2929801 RepID=UPI0028703371
MTPEMRKFIDLLEGQLGYSERGGAYTKFGDWYGKNVEFDADYTSAPWCDMMLSWAAHKLGYEDWMGQFAWTVSHAKWFRKHDAWGHKPQPGAFVFYDWSGSRSIDKIDHVGIVTRVEGDTIYTIEGNIDGGVAKRKERDTSKVVGYGYPWRIKERLDKKAREEAFRRDSVEPIVPPGSDPTQLQAPDSTLGALIPYSEVNIVAPPLAARAKPTAKPTNGAQQAAAPTPAPTAQAQAKPQAVAPTTGSTANADKAAKKGKHAKPVTAGTKAVTSEPLSPPPVDAAAPHPSPALESPALVGSALVAALALLAVAKTRHLRARPALATPAPVPASPARRRHRRTRRPATAPAAAATLMTRTATAAETLATATARATAGAALAAGATETAGATL